MKVYRVEDEQKIGPYTWQTFGLLTPAPAWVPPNRQHLTPQRDGIPNVDKEHRFGFKDMFQLLDWFGTLLSLDNLERGGYLCVQISVPKRLIREGETQLVFRDNPMLRRTVLPWSAVRNALLMYEPMKVGTPNMTKESGQNAS